MSQLEKNLEKGNKMRTMHEGKLLFSMALPLALSMLVQALYNVVDGVFVSWINDGGNAVTALSMAFPVQNLMIGFATGVGVGMNALLSKSLGENNRERANKAAGSGILLTVLAAMLFMLFGIFGARAFFDMQSDVALTVENGTQYISICCIGCLGIFVEVLGERLLQASGKTIFTLFTQGTGAVLNIILDYWFIFGGFGLPAMGIAGAAWATVIGQWVAGLLAVLFNLLFNKDVDFRLRYLKPDWKMIGKVLSIGVPSVVMMAIGSVMTFCMNQVLISFKDTYGETPVGVFGIYFKLQSFFLMPVFGLNNACVSIVAFNYGARQPKRIINTLKYSLGTAFSLLVLGLLVFQLLPDQLLGIFNPTEDFLVIGRSALQTVSWSFPMAAIAIALGASFQALGNGIYSTITSLCRQLVVLVPAAYLLSLSGQVTLVWWAFPIAEVVSLTLSVLFFARLYKKKIRPLQD